MPLPALARPPAPEMVPENVLVAPGMFMVSIPPPSSVTLPLPVSEPMVTRFGPGSNVAPAATVTGELVGIIATCIPKLGIPTAETMALYHWLAIQLNPVSSG